MLTMPAQTSAKKSKPKVPKPKLLTAEQLASGHLKTAIPKLIAQKKRVSPKPEKPKSASVADAKPASLADDADALLAEAYHDAEPATIAKYIGRLYDVEIFCKEKVNRLKHRIGTMLIQVQQTIPGKWEQWVDANCPFSVRTARNYKNIALDMSEDEAADKDSLYNNVIVDADGQARITSGLMKRVDKFQDQLERMKSKTEGLQLDWQELRDFAFRKHRQNPDTPQIVAMTETDIAELLSDWSRQLKGLGDWFAAQSQEPIKEHITDDKGNTFTAGK
jgi:hypothetical protein